MMHYILSVSNWNRYRLWKLWYNFLWKLLLLICTGLTNKDRVIIWLLIKQIWDYRPICPQLTVVLHYIEKLKVENKIFKIFFSPHWECEWWKFTQDSFFDKATYGWENPRNSTLRGGCESKFKISVSGIQGGDQFLQDRGLRIMMQASRRLAPKHKVPIHLSLLCLPSYQFCCLYK